MVASSVNTSSSAWSNAMGAMTFVSNVPRSTSGVIVASGGNGLAPSVLALFTTSWTGPSSAAACASRATVLGVVDVTGHVRPPR